MASVSVDLGPVQTTLLIPLLARAEETQRRRGLLQDPKAVEVVQSLDYDFSKWRGTRSLRGACIRTRMLDEDVADFLSAHPEGTVVELGCGLNTRFHRIDNGCAHWVDLDLPDSMAMRARFIEPQDDRVVRIAASVLDDSWMDTVAGLPGPYCFVSEAVLIYLDNDDAERVLRRIAERFEGSWLLFDTADAAMVRGQDKHDAMRHLPKESHFRWTCDDPAQLERVVPGLRWVGSRTLLDAPEDLVARLPLWMRAFFRWAPRVLTQRMRGYKLNRFEVVA